MPPVDVGWASLSGFAAGYVMALGAYWLEGIVGIPRLDFGHTGMKYLGGEKAGFWFVGILFHLVDSILLALLYAVVVYPHVAHKALEREVLQVAITAMQLQRLVADIEAEVGGQALGHGANGGGIRRAGVEAVRRGLRLLQEQERRAALNQIMQSLAASIEGGSTLSESLAQHLQVPHDLPVR